MNSCTAEQLGNEWKVWLTPQCLPRHHSRTRSFHVPFYVSYFLQEHRGMFLSTVVTHKRFINKWCQPLMNKSSREKKNQFWKYFILFLVFFSCSDSYTVFQPLLFINFQLMDYNSYFNLKQSDSCSHLSLTRAHKHSFVALYDMGTHGMIPWVFPVLAEDAWGERRSLFTRARWISIPVRYGGFGLKLNRNESAAKHGQKVHYKW